MNWTTIKQWLHKIFTFGKAQGIPIAAAADEMLNNVERVEQFVHDPGSMLRPTSVPAFQQEREESQFLPGNAKTAELEAPFNPMRVKETDENGDPIPE